MAKVKNEHYITIQEFMVNDLELSGNELIAYALIYGFSQDGESYFKGSLSYVAKWLNCSKATACNILNKLADDGFLEKKEKNVNGVRLCDYTAYPIDEKVLKEIKERKKERKEKEKAERYAKNFNTQSKNHKGYSKNLNGRSKNLNGGIQKTLTHNTTDILDDTKDENIDDTIANSFSNEKDIQSNSPEGEQSNSFSGEKKTAILNQTKRHSEKEMEDMVNQIPLRARYIAYEMTNDTEKATRVYECIDYFLREYREHSKERHKVLKYETLRKIVFKLIEGIEIERDGYTDVYDGLASTNEFVGDYRDVIDEYFNTDFKEQCDYSLVHFSSDMILINMMNHVCKEEWCESM